MIFFRNNPSILFWEAGNTVVTPDQMVQMVALRKQWDPNGGRVMGTRDQRPRRHQLTPVSEYLRGHDRPGTADRHDHPAGPDLPRLQHRPARQGAAHRDRGFPRRGRRAASGTIIRRRTSASSPKAAPSRGDPGAGQRHLPLELRDLRPRRRRRATRLRRATGSTTPTPRTRNGPPTPPSTSRIPTPTAARTAARSCA